MSPKKITNAASVVAGLSLLVLVATLLGMGWSPLTWWAVVGLGLAFLLILIALFKGMSLATQSQIDRVDMMNDCNAGIPPRDKT